MDESIPSLLAILYPSDLHATSEVFRNLGGLSDDRNYRKSQISEVSEDLGGLSDYRNYRNSQVSEVSENLGDRSSDPTVLAARPVRPE